MNLQPRTKNLEPRTANYEPITNNLQPITYGYKLQVAGSKLQVISSKLQVISFKLQVLGYYLKSWVLRFSGSKLLVTTQTKTCNLVTCEPDPGTLFTQLLVRVLYAVEIKIPAC